MLLRPKADFLLFQKKRMEEMLYLEHVVLDTRDGLHMVNLLRRMRIHMLVVIALDQDLEK